MSTYIVIFIALLILELLYFRIADKFNIIDKPNERSSHFKKNGCRYLDTWHGTPFRDLSKTFV